MQRYSSTGNTGGLYALQERIDRKQVDGDKRTGMMYKFPWDLNNTFGDIWQNDARDTNHTGYHVGKLVQDGAFQVLLDSGDENIYAAIQRDSQRWSECGMGNGNAVNIRDIEDFFREILPRMDAFIESLGTHKQTEE